MPHGPEHHLEEAEHAQHSAHNPFDRRVTLTMAIVAAVLAFVTMLSHRAHNLTLQNQIKSNDSITERANVFAYYQAKKNRQLMDEAFAESLEALRNDSHTGSDKEKAEKTLAKWRSNARKWKEDSDKLEAKGNQLTKDISRYAEEAHKHHHRADFFDSGELGVELSLILCSLALLTKDRRYWYAGIVAVCLGISVAAAGYLIAPMHQEHEPEEGSHSTAVTMGAKRITARTNNQPASSTSPTVRSMRIPSSRILVRKLPRVMPRTFAACS